MSTNMRSRPPSFIAVKISASTRCRRGGNVPRPLNGHRGTDENELSLLSDTRKRSSDDVLGSNVLDTGDDDLHVGELTHNSSHYIVDGFYVCHSRFGASIQAPRRSVGVVPHRVGHIEDNGLEYRVRNPRQGGAAQ